MGTFLISLPVTVSFSEFHFDSLGQPGSPGKTLHTLVAPTVTGDRAKTELRKAARTSHCILTDGQRATRYPNCGKERGEWDSSSREQALYALFASGGRCHDGIHIKNLGDQFVSFQRAREPHRVQRS